MVDAFLARPTTGVGVNGKSGTIFEVKRSRKERGCVGSDGCQGRVLVGQSKTADGERPALAGSYVERPDEKARE